MYLQENMGEFKMVLRVREVFLMEGSSAFCLNIRQELVQWGWRVFLEGEHCSQRGEEKKYVCLARAWLVWFGQRPSDTGEKSNFAG